MVKEIDLVKKFISLLLISVCLGDTLILKDKTKYNGNLIKFGSDEIMFKYFLPYSLKSNKLAVFISEIEELKLSNGTIIVENGVFKASYEEYMKRFYKHKNVKSTYTMIGCSIISVAAVGVYYILANSCCAVPIH